MKGLVIPSESRSRCLRTLGIIGVLVALVTTLYLLLLRSPTRVYEATDFLGYWGAANLLAHRENPYDQEALLALEQQQGWLGSEPVYSWNPPWLHLLLVPFGALSFRQAAALWFVINPLLLGLSALLMWQVVSKRRGLREVGLVLLATFIFSRSLHAVLEGQINTLVLVGCAGFLALALQHRDFLAGALLVLVTVKPHLSYLFLPAVLWISLLRRRWRIIVGFSACLVLLVSSTSWLFPYWGDAYLSILEVAASPLRTTAYITPTIRGFLLAITGLDIGALPAAICLVAFLVLIPLRGGGLDLPSITSLSLIVGLPTAPFGWSTDQILLLLPILQIIAWMPRMGLVDKRIVVLSLTLTYGYALLVWLLTYRDVALLVLPLMIGLVWGYSRWKASGGGWMTDKVVDVAGDAIPQ